MWKSLDTTRVFSIKTQRSLDVLIIRESNFPHDFLKVGNKFEFLQAWGYLRLRRIRKEKPIF